MCSSTICTDARRTFDAFVQFQRGPIVTVRREDLNAIILAVGTDDIPTGVDEQSRWVVHFSIGSAVTTEHRRTVEVEVITNARAVDQTAAKISDVDLVVVHSEEARFSVRFRQDLSFDPMVRVLLQRIFGLLIDGDALLEHQLAAGRIEQKQTAVLRRLIIGRFGVDGQQVPVTKHGNAVELLYGTVANGLYQASIGFSDADGISFDDQNVISRVAHHSAGPMKLHTRITANGVLQST